MAKRGKRSKLKKSLRFRVGVAWEVLQVWRSNGYTKDLNKLALAAYRLLKEVFPEETTVSGNDNTNIGYEPPSSANVEQQRIGRSSGERA
jgi:hypothetical protein